MGDLSENREDVLNLIEESITKWQGKLERAKANKDFSIGRDDCPLCEEFHEDGAIAPCIECPIMTKTGAKECNKTPWLKVYFACSTGSREGIVEAVREEIDFLQEVYSDYKEGKI